MARAPRTRTEVDKVLRDNGYRGLFKNEGEREKVAWAEKQHRTGGDRKTLPDPRKDT